MRDFLDSAKESMAWSVKKLVARGIIEHAKHARAYVYYAHLAWTLGLAPGGSQLAQLLGELVEEDEEASIPFRSALVIGQRTRMPGDGYFAKLASLGHDVPADADLRRKFWEAQVANVYAV